MTNYDFMQPMRWIAAMLGRLFATGAFIIGIATPILTVVALVMLIKYLRKKNKEM